MEGLCLCWRVTRARVSRRGTGWLGIYWGVRRGNKRILPAAVLISILSAFTCPCLHGPPVVAVRCPHDRYRRSVLADVAMGVEDGGYFGVYCGAATTALICSFLYVDALPLSEYEAVDRGWATKMHFISNEVEVLKLERTRTLVGTYLDNMYSADRLKWVLGVREGFDEHVGEAFHLLVPHKDDGYTINMSNEICYGTKLARRIIDKLEIRHEELPCIVFRASGSDHFFLKLGNRDRDGVCNIVGRIGDLAVKSAKEGPADPEKFREFVNMRTAKFLRNERALSALANSLPALSALLGSIVGLAELV